MIQQEQLPSFDQPPPHPRQDLVDLFQDVAQPPKFMLGREEDPHPHPQPDEDPIQPDPHLSSLNLSLLEKEDSNCPFPEKLVDEAGEEDEVLMNIAPSTTVPSPPLSLKKETKIDRNAYLQETRAAKIDRYLQKKQRRIWDRKIFYDCRKVVADNRERVNGRFVKKSPLPNHHSSARKTSTQEHLELQILRQFQLEGGGLEDCYL